jgi:L-ascorbate metabolism protein UlaG (beta-lactamase superfamily)
VDGLNLLVDPIWSERASPVSWTGPRRVRPPGIQLEDLPPLDAILISHNHYDHLDKLTLRRLGVLRPAATFAGLGNGKVLRALGLQGVTELDWWQGVQLSPEVRLVFVPARHFSSRGLLDRNRSLWGGFMVQGPGGTVYIAGDTGFGAHFAEIRRRFGPVRLAVLPIGAFRPRWLMGQAHLSPEDAVRALQELQGGTGLAVHHGTFALADDGQDEPVEELVKAMARDQIGASRFWVLQAGEGREVPPR